MDRFSCVCAWLICDAKCYCLRQVNGVNSGDTDTVFDRCTSLCASVGLRSGPLNQTSGHYWNATISIFGKYIPRDSSVMKRRYKMFPKENFVRVRGSQAFCGHVSVSLSFKGKRSRCRYPQDGAWEKLSTALFVWGSQGNLVAKNKFWGQLLRLLQ